ncbi:MAG: Hpt domain-containing protein [Methyloceanibacter sp.]|uniref:Hpt domain-containing protein n=1 Tax=Methyloceanibacter sp. TaxID=1965321 RepID=UPI003D6D6B48
MASERAIQEPDGGRKFPSKPVDLVHLSRYTLGERALEREVLELFCSQSVLYLEQLRAAMSDRAWKEAAHSLKGSSRAIGAWRTAQAAERAEALHGDGLAQFRAARIGEIEASLREAEAYIAILLKDR